MMAGVKVTDSGAKNLSRNILGFIKKYGDFRRILLWILKKSGDELLKGSSPLFPLSIAFKLFPVNQDKYFRGKKTGEADR